MSLVAPLEPYVDGYYGPIGTEATVIPRVQFPFKDNPIASDTYSRLYERDFDITPGSLPRVDQRTAWTNLVTYSQDFENAAWTKTNLTISANNTTAPDGLVTMDKLLESSATGEHSVSQAVTVTAAAHELSFFIKGGLTRSWVRAAFTDSGSTVRSAFFSTSGYAISATSGTVAKIVGLGNGHFHCVLRFTPAAGAGTFKVNVSTDGSSISYAGNTANGVYLWGAQVALGSIAPHVSTLGATRTILAPDRDPRDPLAFLLMESDPEPVNSCRSRVTRIFGRVPKTQIVTGSRSIPKPRIAGTFPRVINGKLVYHPDDDSDEWHFYPRIAVVSDSGAPVSLTTGGTYDLDFEGDSSTGLAWNASAGTVETALIADTTIPDYGTLVVTGSHTAGFEAKISYSTATVNIGSLSVTGGFPGASVVLSDNGLTQTVKIVPYLEDPGPSGTSFFTPDAANPMFVSTITGERQGDISFSMGNPSNSAPATGGTFNLSVYGQNASLNATDSMATIQAALNALSEVSLRGGYTVTSLGLANFTPVYVASFLSKTLVGTFTIDIFGETTAALDFDSTTGEIETALNALSEVTARGGCTVSGAGFSGGKQSFVISFAEIPAITGDASSLTPTGNIGVTRSNRGSVQRISFTTTSTTTRILSAPSHGITGTENILVNTTLVSPAGYAVLDANTISLNSASGFLNYGFAIAYIGPYTAQIYAADSPEIPVNFISYYFLPGVTPDVDEVDDFVIPKRGTPAQLLGAIFSGATLFNYETGSIAQWEKTPVHSLTLQTINPQHLISPSLL